MPVHLSSPAVRRRGHPRVVVDRTGSGQIRGVSVLTTGPAHGHGFSIDTQTVCQVVELGNGIRGHWTHGQPTYDSLSRHLGEWSQLRAEPFQVCRPCRREVQESLCTSCGAPTETAWRALGDFTFSPSAWNLKPDGLDVPAPEYLMARAEEDPQSLGVSIVAELNYEEPASGERVARIRDRQLLRADWVGAPAANPTGLEVQEPWAPSSEALDELVALEGQERARLRVFAYLARYFGDTSEEEAPPALPLSQGAPTPRVEDAPAVRALQAQLHALARQVKSLRGERHEDALQALRRRATEAGAPLTAADLAAVEGLLSSGADDAATLLGDALLQRAAQQAQPAFDPTSVTALALPPLTSASTPEGSRAAQAAVLKASPLPVFAAQTPTEVTS